jgi:hypothetical protein
MKKLLLLIPILAIMIPQTLFASPLYQVPDPYDPQDSIDYIYQFIENYDSGYLSDIDTGVLNSYGGLFQSIYESILNDSKIDSLYLSTNYLHSSLEEILDQSLPGSIKTLFVSHIRYVGFVYYEYLVRQDELFAINITKLTNDAYNDGFSAVDLDEAIVSTQNENIKVTLTNGLEYTLTNQYNEIKNYERGIADSFNLTSFIPQILSLVFGFFFSIFDITILGVSLLSFLQILIAFILIYTVFRMLYAGK